MKASVILIYSSILLFIAAIFVPYLYHYALSGLLDPHLHLPTLVPVKINGIETGLSMLPTAWLIFPLGSHFNKNSKSSALGVILSAGLIVLIQIALFFRLTSEPSYYKGYTNVELSFGYYFNCLGAVTLLVGGFLAYSKHRARLSKENSDLLDSI